MNPTFSSAAVLARGDLAFDEMGWECNVPALRQGCSRYGGIMLYEIFLAVYRSPA